MIVLHSYKNYLFGILTDTECVAYSPNACLFALKSIGYQRGSNENSGFKFQGAWSTPGK